jgi:integrase
LRIVSGVPARAMTRVKSRVKPSARTKQKKEHRVPLSAPARQLLCEIKSQASNSPYVFPGRVPGEPLQEIKSFWAGVCKQASLEDCRIHDLRHTYASILASAGLSLPVIGALLGLTQPDRHTGHKTGHLPLSKRDVRSVRSVQSPGFDGLSFRAGNRRTSTRARWSGLSRPRDR